jgi:hypothetical protein
VAAHREEEEGARYVNQYGALARQHQKRWRPASYAAITDPAAYFTDLGEQAAGEITALWAQMRAQAGNPPGEDYLARVARLNALRKQAEEVVLADLILLPPERDAIEFDWARTQHHKRPGRGNSRG